MATEVANSMGAATARRLAFLSLRIHAQVNVDEKLMQNSSRMNAGISLFLTAALAHFAIEQQQGRALLAGHF